MFISGFHLPTKSRGMRGRLAAVFSTALLLASMGVFGTATVSAAVQPDTALAIATALASPSANVTGASFVSPTTGTPNGTSTTTLGGFPTNGTDFGILTTGNVSSVQYPGTLASTANPEPTPLANRGSSAFDVTVLKVDISVPETANCLAFDFKFLSEEFPQYVGTSFNDAFIAELDPSTPWTTSGSSTITAPDNFAFDTANHVVSVNSTGLGGLSPLDGAGTAFDSSGTEANGGGTVLLHASTQVNFGPHSVYFSIFDQGDQVLDSAVFLDNLTVGFVENPAVNCKQGATPVNYKLTLAPATATNPVGTPHTVTATLTGPSVADKTVSFTVTGANAPASGTGTTDLNGITTFTYTGTNVGHDQIDACYNADLEPPCEATASATKDWTAPSADLSLSKSASPNPVNAGTDITYTLTVHNTGPNPAADASVVDHLPAGVIFRSASTGCTYLANTNTVTCVITSPIAIASESNPDRQFTIVATATTAGAPCNSASVSSTTSDSNSDNNSASACTTVNPAVTTTCPPAQLCSASITSPDGTNASITGGPGSKITASFSTLAQANFTACTGYAPPNPNSVLTFNVTNSHLPKLIKFVEKVLVGPVRICWNAPHTFRQRGGTWAPADPKGGFTGLLPDCLIRNATLPCVSPPLTRNGISTLLILAPAGDPKMY